MVTRKGIQYSSHRDIKFSTSDYDVSRCLFLASLMVVNCSEQLSWQLKDVVGRAGSTEFGRGLSHLLPHTTKTIQEAITTFLIKA